MSSCVIAVVVTAASCCLVAVIFIVIVAVVILLLSDTDSNTIYAILTQRAYKHLELVFLYCSYNKREKARNASLIVEMNGATTKLINPEAPDEEPKSFTFDYSYWSHDGFAEDETGYLGATAPNYADQVCEQRLLLFIQKNIFSFLIGQNQLVNFCYYLWASIIETMISQP